MARRIQRHLVRRIADLDGRGDLARFCVDHRDRVVGCIGNKDRSRTRIDFNAVRTLPTSIAPVIEPDAMPTTVTEFPLVT
jgi:hypothetical protein